MGSKLTEQQSAKIAELEAVGVTCYETKVQGKGVVQAFERYLDSGDSAKITPALYGLLTMRCGFIAHYDLANFRRVYTDPANLLRGELYGYRTFGLAEPALRPIDGSRYVYKDGMTDIDVLDAIKLVARKFARVVAERSAGAVRQAEIAEARRLAESNGFKLVEA